MWFPLGYTIENFKEEYLGMNKGKLSIEEFSKFMLEEAKKLDLLDSSVVSIGTRSDNTVAIFVQKDSNLVKEIVVPLERR